jgi:hypothetical protein
VDRCASRSLRVVRVIEPENDGELPLIVVEPAE